MERLPWAVTASPKRIVAQCVHLGHVPLWTGPTLHAGMIVRSATHSVFLTLSLALKQFSLKIISLQWIFAFIIFGIFLVSSLYSSSTRYYKRDFFLRSLVEPEAGDREREPLLSNA
ncbi:hypothetical protein CIHG_09135 [Coccidioides immitis H538.4]|uniref:Uncharacterized protein n=1 Tax=Coccidioides immitis H538.4 TaxID=396776 RepID=A0A0J8S1X9_COCIT|nr:hypothetical protein CIHG_09135 [Coccidioides immitis H538.4]